MTGLGYLLSTKCFEIQKEFERIFDEEPQTVNKWLRWADTALKLLGKEIPIQHISGEDIVHEIIFKTFSGDRTWDIDILPINVYMYNSIKSEVSNAKTNEKQIIHAEINDTDEDKDNNEPSSNSNLLNILEENDLIKLCERAIETNYDCSVLFEAMKEVDPSKNKEIAENTGFSVPKVENIKKRLFRILNQVLANYKYK